MGYLTRVTSAALTLICQVMGMPFILLVFISERIDRVMPDSLSPFC